MENNPNPIEKLIEKTESYGKTSLELCKHSAILKTSDVLSSIAAKIIIIVFVTMFTLFMNIGLALWVGTKYFDDSYSGFFVIGLVYLFFGILFYIFRNSWIKNPMSNSIIVKLLNED